MSLRKFEISFDEERINQFDEYTSEALYDALDKSMQEGSIVKTGKGIYEGNNSSDFIVMYFYLFNRAWFMKYVKTWYSYHDGGVEDVVKYAKIKERQIANEFK